ncbi:COG4315 family predicted lipoprotein [Lentzea sp. CA-135723]|uniref:COG4315 family predicted lipoprotein n=1 Tax=Lentzea sp. CA-135723 TaxID=3239950 RepID=UPI003D8ABA35
MRARMGILLLPALLAGLAACGSEAPQQGARQQEVPANVQVKIVQSELGPILADQTGRTLYAFTKDENKPAECDADCIAVWPALTSQSKADVADGADGELVSQEDESSQVVYGKWPVYYYVGDQVAGDVNGQGVDEEWFAIAADGKLVKKS